jgi:hypothetical protein
VFNFINDIEVTNFNADDFRDLTPQEKQDDDFRRMFQMLGLIYRNQIEIKDMLKINSGVKNVQFVDA